MSFAIPVEVRDLLASGGQRVSKGTVLVQARDSTVQALLKQQQVRAGATYEISAAEENVRFAQFNYDQLHDGKDKGTGTPKELIEAEVALASAKYSLEQAQSNHQLEGYRLDQAKGEAERYRLEAPFDGIVEEIKVDIGQGVRDGEPVLRIVNTDRLRLDAYTPVDQTIQLNIQSGDTAWVLLDLPVKPVIVQGTVLYVSPVADSVSQTRRVRVEIQNVGDWPAGTQAMVRFRAPDAEWKDFIVPVPATTPTTASAEGPTR